jgi:hypothetical protein
MTSMIQQYKISSSAFATLLGSVKSLPGIPHHGARALMAGLQESMDMIKDMLNISKVQALGGVLNQLHGHESIDSMLQDLIEGYLGNIRSFQGLTTPIEFQKPSFVQVHTGEKLYPAGKTENNNINFAPTIYVSGAKDPEASAKEIDSKLADMWRTGRSRLKKVIK